MRPVVGRRGASFPVWPDREHLGMAAESLAWFLIVVAIFGLIVGAIGRLLVPGPTPLGVIGTMGAGVAGALIGGLVGRLLLGPNLTQGWMWVLSILGAALVVALVSRRGRAYGGRPPRRRLMWERPHGDQVVVDDGDARTEPTTAAGRHAACYRGAPTTIRRRST
ncbi:MAG: hypothetical protein LC799_20710, partial [Actinobacteria bacterium]|nr:hypothetical protein [Actinomycetota bacterium]